MEIALKIDVDTHQGLGEGVPRLMRVLTALDVTATFALMARRSAGCGLVRSESVAGVRWLTAQIWCAIPG